MTPVPWKRLSALLVVQLNEAICTSMLLPFVGFLVARIEGDKDISAAGFQSGFLLAMFQLAQFLSCRRWGRLSDVYGRKPVLQLGLLLSSICVIGFGFSFNMWWAMVARFLHGLVNGNVAVAKTVIADITDDTNRAIGFAAISASYGIGGFLGPAIGGVLYDPAFNDHLAFLGLSKTGIFASYPALLPCIAVACYSMTALVVSIFTLSETNPHAVSFSWKDLFDRGLGFLNEKVFHLPSMGKNVHQIGEASMRREVFNSASTPDFSAAAEASSPHLAPARRQFVAKGPASPVKAKDGLQKFGWKECFTTPKSFYTVVLYMIISAVDFGFSETFSLWAMTDVPRGGMSWSAESIGLFNVLQGLFNLVVNLSFPLICKRVSSLHTFWRYSLVIQMWGTLLIPFSNSWGEGSSTGILFMSVVSFARIFGSFSSFGLIYLFVADAAPLEVLGTMAGIAQASCALVRCIFPIIAAPLYAASVVYPCPPLFDYHFIFVLFGLLLISGVAVSIPFEGCCEEAARQEPEEIIVPPFQKNPK